MTVQHKTVISLTGECGVLPELILQQLGMTDTTTQDVDQTDGVRLTLNNGHILHFRASGNAPELRIYSEADTDITAKHLAQLGTKLKLN